LAIFEQPRNNNFMALMPAPADKADFGDFYSYSTALNKLLDALQGVRE